MSLFSSIGGALKGALGGFARGGVSGALGGALGGLMGGPKNPAKTKNLQPVLSAQREAARSGGAVGVVNQYSASPYVRAAYSGTLAALPPSSIGGGQVMMQMPGIGYTSGQPTVAAGGSVPMWAYRRFYTKKGTPRRTRKDGQPYGIPTMNPMNYRAASRAIRRIRGARKLLQRIERTLPKAHTRRRAA